MSNNQLRSSQIVTTFGPGAMVDLPDASVIVAGLDHWAFNRIAIPIVHEPRLEAKLKKLLQVPELSLRTPPPANDQHTGFEPYISAWRFPEWFMVQKTETVNGYRRRRLVHLDKLDGGKYRDIDRQKYPVVPVRFVRACRRGHVGDIDWIAFVHGSHLGCPRDLWIEERGTSGDLSEVRIACDCGKERPLTQAARLELRALGSCNGSRPWLGARTREACGEANRLLIRSASNAYFPQIMSVISIPDSHSPIDAIVRELWGDFLSDVESLQDLQRCKKKPTPASRLDGLDDNEIMKSIARVRGGSDENDIPVKEVEFLALSEAREELGNDAPDGDFFARAMRQQDWEAPHMESIDRIVLVHRLREVSAQIGFTRFEAAGPDIEGELSIQVERATLALDSPWLPALENRGEGIFIKFKNEYIDRWIRREAVSNRGRVLLEGFKIWRDDHQGSNRDFPGLAYFLLHSFSHLLLAAISLECGYPASSLRERVYAFRGDYGVLIYTGSSDSEGTLGGLILAGREIRRHVQRALEMGMLCSNDPVCAFHLPTRHDPQQLLGSACHGCLLISETSCEQRNEFLDRALVIPTMEQTGTEFFSGV